MNEKSGMFLVILFLKNPPHQCFPFFYAFENVSFVFLCVWVFFFFHTLINLKGTVKNTDNRFRKLLIAEMDLSVRRGRFLSQTHF